jgi:hypothetical protein
MDSRPARSADIPLSLHACISLLFLSHMHCAMLRADDVLGSPGDGIHPFSRGEHNNLNEVPLAKRGRDESAH